MFERVREFHRVFGHLVADSPALPAQTIRDLRVRLLREELDEFCTAHATNHLVEMADGLADICVIIAGTMVAYGIVPGDGKFESPYPDGTKAFLSERHHHTFTPILCKSFATYELAEQDDDLETIKHTLMIMLTDVCGIAVNLGIPLNAVFSEVHRSNMAKLMPDGSVLRREDGKVLKVPWLAAARCSQHPSRIPRWLMFDAVGFDPKTLSNEQLLDRQMDLVSKKMIAARYGKADIVNQLHLMIQMIERERYERIFNERVGSVLLKSSPIVVESDPDLSEKQHSLEEEKKQQAKPGPSRAYAKPLRSHVPVRSK